MIKIPKNGGETNRLQSVDWKKCARFNSRKILAELGIRLQGKATVQELKHELVLGIVQESVQESVQELIQGLIQGLVQWLVQELVQELVLELMQTQVGVFRSWGDDKSILLMWRSGFWCLHSVHAIKSKYVPSRSI